MEDVLIPLVIVISVLAAAVALFTLAGSGRLLRTVGSGGIEAAAQAATARPPGEREQEIRELLDACNASRERRGQRQLEPDDELAALARPALEHELHDEVRALVEARNRRRERAGLPPLDPDSETERQLRELT